MSFKPKGVDSNNEDTKKTYKMCYADWDTPVFAAANLTQTEKIKVTHIKSGDVKILKNVTEFRGRINKKTGEFGGRLGALNEKYREQGKKELTLDEFKIEPIAEINKPEDPNKTILEEALEYFDRQVGKLKKHMDSEDYRLIIGDGTNPRYSWANILPYKGDRKEKPILFSEVRELILEKYKSKIILAVDKEGDDEISKFAWSNYQNFLKTGKWENCIAYVDKDIDMCPSPSFNYNKVEEGFTIRELDECMRIFAAQCLSGDLGTDNIQGLPNVSEEFCKKYEIRRFSGLGKTTADKIIAKAESRKEVWEIVCEAYKSYYTEDSYTFNGKEMSWLDILNENARLLWMYRDDSMEFDIIDLLIEVGVEYD